MKNTIPFFLLFIFYYQNISAQYTINGKITDALTNEPLIATNVFLKSDFSKGTQTDLEGNFQLIIENENSPPRFHIGDTLLITYIGYEEMYFPISKNKTSINIALQPMAFKTAVAVVKAEKAVAREFAASTINKLDIYLNPNSKADPLLAVDALPASTGTEETANISLRGSSPAETGIFLNNVPLNDAVRLDQANGVGQFSIFNTAMIEDLQVYPSNPPVEFGNATSGVIALYTEEKAAININSVVATVVGGGIYLGRELSPTSSLTVYGNHSTDKGFVSLNKKSLKDLKGFSASDAGIYYVKQFSEKILLKAFNYSMLENYQFNLRLPTVHTSFNQKKIRNQSVINLVHKLPNGQLDFNQGINFSKGDYVLENIESHVRDFDYYASLNWSKNFKNGQLKSGASWMRFKQKVIGRYPLYAYAIGNEFPSIDFNEMELVNIPEAYIYYKKYFNEKWVVGIGGRWHGDFYGLKNYWNAQGNLFYKIKKNQQLIFSFGQYNKFLLPDAEIPTTTLLTSRQLALDYQYKKDDWFATAAIYAKENTADYLNNNSVMGAEFFVRWTKNKVKASLSMTTVQSTLKTENIEYPSAHDLGYYLRAQIKWDIPNICEVNAIYKHRQGKYYLPITGSSHHIPTDTYIPEYTSIDAGERLSDYRLLDVSFSRMFPFGNGVLIAFLNFNNIFDFKNTRGYEYNNDYSNKTEEYFARRVMFFGGVYQWE